MKQKLLNFTRLRSLVLLAVIAFLGAGSAWGEEATISSFSATSGSIDSHISYAAYKGNGTTDPAVSNNTLRIYKPSSGNSDGGYITISAAANYAISSVTITNSSDKAGTIKTSVDGGSLSDGVSLAKQASHTVDKITASSVSFYNCGSDRLSIAGFTVTYASTGGPVTTYTVTFDAGDGTFVGSTDFPNTSNTIAAGSYTLPSATRTGYTFDGWVTGNNQPVTGVYNVSDDVDFTANYTLGYCATYAVSSTSAVTTSGTAPTNSSATFSQTFNTAKQMTSNNSMTLKLSGYEGKRVKRIVLSMKSNSGGGAGWMSATAGTTTLASIGSSGNGVAFSDDKWNGAYSTSYGDVEIDMSNTTYDIQEDEDIEIYIEATSNSLYCESFKIYYEDSPTDPFVSASDVNIAYDATNGSITYTIGNEPDPAGTLTAAITAGNEGNWLTLGSVSTNVPFTCSANTAYTARTATVRLTYTYGNSETATKDVVITQAAAPKALSSIALSGAYPTTFYVGDEFSHEGMTVTATYNDSSTEDVTASASFTGYDMSQTGEQTVTVTYTSNNVSRTQTYTITVNEIPTKTIAQFISDEGGKCYLTGTVSNIVNTKYGNFDLTDESGTIYVYGCLTSAGGSAQFSTLNIEENDVIKVLANEYTYYNNTTHEAVNVIFVEEIVPNAQTLTVSATNGSVEITGKTLDNGSCEVTEGANVEATATPAEHYTFTSWTAEGVTLADATANPLTFTMPTNGVTLTANFTEDAKHTATFYVQGAVLGTDANVYEGEAITFPSVTAPTGYTFMGWTTAAINGSQNAAPATLVTSANMGNADVNYYAVFAVGSAGGNEVGTLSGSDITEWDGMAYSDDETTHTLDNITWSVRGNRGSDNPWIQIRSNATPSYIKITTSGSLSNVSLSISNTSNSSGGINDITKHGEFGGSIFLSTTTSSDNAIVSASAEDKAASLNLPENTNYKEVYIIASGSARIWEVDVTYIGSTYSGYCTTVTALSAKFNASGYATFASSVPVDYSDDSEFSAWQITAANSNTGVITFSQIKGDVAAGTGVLLKGTASTSISIPVANSGSDISSTNKLVGITTPTAVAADTYYGLSGNTFVKVNAGTVPAGKALLPASTLTSGGSGAKAFTFVFETVDGIKTVEHVSAEEAAEIFNLAGQRLSKAQKGVNIINGKKVLVK